MSNIIAICPMEQWTGVIDPDKKTYLEVPGHIDVDQEVENCNYGENSQILVDHFLSLGAKIVDCPIQEIVV